MDLSQGALRSSQAALDVTARNVANQNVQGYTRQVISWSADVVTINGAAVGAGGSTGLTATSQRDRVLEQRVQQQTQVTSAAAARQSALGQLQSVFGLSSTTTSALSTVLGSAIDGLYNSFSALASSPADTASRQAVISAAQTMTSAFRSASGQIASVNADLSQTALGVVGEVNGLTKTIATLNKQIGALSPNADAGGLEDQRQAAIAQLSQYIGLNQTTTEGNGVTLSASDGTLLVSGQQSFALQATASGTGVQITAAGSATDISGVLQGGQLGGILSVQKNDIAPIATALDQLAYAIGTSVNTQNASGMDGNGAAGGLLFILPGAGNTAATISVATTDPTKIAAAGVGEGTAGNTNINQLAKQGISPIVSGQSAPSFLAGMLSGLGSSVAGAASESSAQQATLTQLTTQRNSLSGVSLDEEAASLTQYQRSYQAAAKVFAIANTMLEAAINLGSSTTV